MQDARRYKDLERHLPFYIYVVQEYQIKKSDIVVSFGQVEISKPEHVIHPLHYYYWNYSIYLYYYSLIDSTKYWLKY